MVPHLIVHGGAGDVERDRWSRTTEGCRAAVAAGLTILAGGGSALDAVQAAVRVLEDDPEFNAGVGAALTRDGTVELDASIMEGTTLRAGAVAAVPELPRPVDLARAVLEADEHVLLVGEAAWSFAGERGFERDVTGHMITERQRRSLEGHLRRDPAPGRPSGGGTVGACAIDVHGRCAAATSTGGLTGKRRGRVGDSPLIGCGTYADDSVGAASATGEGERIIRVTLTRFVIERLRAGDDANAAARAGIDELAHRVRGSGGIIVVDRSGRVGLAHNTANMAWASGAVGGPIEAGIDARGSSSAS